MSPNESSVRVLNKLLRKLHGFNVTQVGTMGANGSQLRVYQVGDRRHQTRNDICKALEKKASSIVSGKKDIDLTDQYFPAYQPEEDSHGDDRAAKQSENIAIAYQPELRTGRGDLPASPLGA